MSTDVDLMEDNIRLVKRFQGSSRAAATRARASAIDLVEELFPDIFASVSYRNAMGDLMVDADDLINKGVEVIQAKLQESPWVIKVAWSQAVRPSAFWASNIAAEYALEQMEEVDAPPDDDSTFVFWWLERIAFFELTKKVAAVERGQ